MSCWRSRADRVLVNKAFLTYGWLGAPEYWQRFLQVGVVFHLESNAWSMVRTWVVFFQVPFTESSDVKESGQRQVEKHIAEMGLPWTSFRRVTNGRLMMLALEGLLSS